MSISIGGLGGALPDPLGRGAERAEAPPPRGADLPAMDLPVPGDAASVEVTGGSEFWDFLTREERAYYLRNSITGSATYDIRRGAVASPGAGARLGGRLDVRA